MNFKKILITLVITGLAFISCKTETKEEVNTNEKEVVNVTDAKEVAINISGMTCEIGCAKLIQSKLSKQEGVIEAKVVFNDSIATVKYDGAKINKTSLIAFVGGIAGGMYSANEVALKSFSGECKKGNCSDKESKSCHGEDKTSCTADCKKECCTKQKA